MDMNKICGIVKNFDNIKNLVINESDYNDPNVKELIYSTEFSEVEALVGFENCQIAEYEIDDSYVRDACKFLNDSPNIQGIIFLQESKVMIIVDLIFFSSYIQDQNGCKEEYNSLVETFTYDDDESAELISEDWRLL